MMDGRERAFFALVEEAGRAATEAKRLVDAAESLLSTQRDQHHYRPVRDAALRLASGLEEAKTSCWMSLRPPRP